MSGYIVQTGGHHWVRDTLRDAMRAVRRLQEWSNQPIFVARHPGKTIWLWAPGSPLNGTHVPSLNAERKGKLF